MNPFDDVIPAGNVGTEEGPSLFDSYGDEDARETGASMWELWGAGCGPDGEGREP